MRAFVVLLLLVLARPVAAEPSDRTLVLTGLAMAPVDYLLGVAMHEGSHAVAAKLVGAEVIDVHLFPPGRDPKAGKFRFGWTYVRGLEGDRERAFFYSAPKLLDLALLGGFAALVYTDAWPSNRYGQLALTVAATGLWVDFAKDVLAFSKHNDVTKTLNLWCMTGWRQIPARLVFGAAAVGLGFIVWRGYERTFDRTLGDEASARVVPILSSSF